MRILCVSEPAFPSKCRPPMMERESSPIHGLNFHTSAALRQASGIYFPGIPIFLPLTASFA